MRGRHPEGGHSLTPPNSNNRLNVSTPKKRKHATFVVKIEKCNEGAQVPTIQGAAIPTGVTSTISITFDSRAKGKLRGKQPKLSDKQQNELRRMYDTGDYSISDVSEVFVVSRPTVSRTLGRAK